MSGTWATMGAWYSGHSWQEISWSRFPGEHLRCRTCGAEEFVLECPGCTTLFARPPGVHFCPDCRVMLRRLGGANPLRRSGE